MILTPKAFWAYLKQREILQAEEQLRFISSSSVPHLKDKIGKERVVKQYLAIIDPNFEEKEEAENQFKINKLMDRFRYKGKR